MSVVASLVFRHLCEGDSLVSIRCFSRLWLCAVTCDFFLERMTSLKVSQFVFLLLLFAKKALCELEVGTVVVDDMLTFLTLFYARHHHENDPQPRQSLLTQIVCLEKSAHIHTHNLFSITKSISVKNESEIKKFEVSYVSGAKQSKAAKKHKVTVKTFLGFCQKHFSFILKVVVELFSLVELIKKKYCLLS